MSNDWDRPHELIESALKDETRIVFYSAYKEGRNDESVAIEGKAIIMLSYDPCWAPKGEGVSYQADVENPTWIDLAIHCNHAINSVKDYHHVFFEGIRKIGNSITGVPIYEFIMGS